MSILIKGMKMPESGYIDISLHTFADGKKCAMIQTGEKPFYKKLDIVEVPTPHGDLIDRDETEVDVWEDYDGLNYQLYGKTVIEAEDDK